MADTIATCNKAGDFIPFPKISGKTTDFLLNLHRLKDSRKLHESTIELKGTVKLHGMHADIVFGLKDSTAKPTFQSRNRVCDPEESMQGWPRNIATRSLELSALVTNILNRFKDRNPLIPVDNDKPLIIAGEWIGPKVQPGVGVSHISARFIIIAIQVNGVWQPDADYAEIEEPSAAIYSILRVPQYAVRLDISDRRPNNPALLEIQQLSDEVEKACPYAAHFGIHKSKGEGIVWKPNIPEGLADPKYWLKTKGPASGPENRINNLLTGSNTDKIAATANEAARKWLTERRIEQSFEYIREMGHANTARSEREFIKWATNDIVNEEKSTIAEIMESDLTFEKLLRQEIYCRARQAFLTRPKRNRKTIGLPKASAWYCIDNVQPLPMIFGKNPEQLQTASTAVADAIDRIVPLQIDPAETPQQVRTANPRVTHKTPEPETVDAVGAEQATLPVKEMTNEERFLQAMANMGLS
ncbi:uncharacterized protein HMPREF1541_01793 [Cyphellophora europaea CBS 101466]|uniref:RNA ligase domain-containing protein n=1 Tax=Cyphellophora europaea (strain CBS 101466) TaxID=1220924 RepID=W2S1N3_CYPE1|nr:uncharacterized protein HMPREF1541_01793 [Cyphellophora europaea CBS 101466]ETN42636.1 hypothetical protein HMPREF1541_01793 [Cyphellophora europaea CBS 101466]